MIISNIMFIFHKKYEKNFSHEESGTEFYVGVAVHLNA